MHVSFLRFLLPTKNHGMFAPCWTTGKCSKSKETLSSSEYSFQLQPWVFWVYRWSLIFWCLPFHHQSSPDRVPKFLPNLGQDGWWIYKYYRNSIGLHTEWPQRQALLKQQIQQIDPEILCLQATWHLATVLYTFEEGFFYRIIVVLLLFM